MIGTHGGWLICNYITVEISQLVGKQIALWGRRMSQQNQNLGHGPQPEPELPTRFATPEELEALKAQEQQPPPRPTVQRPTAPRQNDAVRVRVSRPGPFDMPPYARRPFPMRRPRPDPTPSFVPVARLFVSTFGCFLMAGCVLPIIFAVLFFLLSLGVSFSY